MHSYNFFQVKEIGLDKNWIISPLCAVNSSFGGARRQRFHVCIRRAFEFASEATAEKNRRAPGGAH